LTCHAAQPSRRKPSLPRNLVCNRGYTPNFGAYQASFVKRLPLGAFASITSLADANCSLFDRDAGEWLHGLLERLERVRLLRERTADRNPELVVDGPGLDLGYLEFVRLRGDLLQFGRAEAD